MNEQKNPITLVSGPRDSLTGMEYSPLVNRTGGEGSRAWNVHGKAMGMARDGKDIIFLSIGDPDFDYLVQDIASLDEVRSQNSVSLNLEAREAELEERRLARLDRENLRRSTLGLESLTSLDELEEDERPDILLRQAAEIVTDLAMLQAGGAAVLTGLGTH